MNKDEIVERIEFNENNNKLDKKPKNLRDNLYGRIDVSIKTMDKFILGVTSLLVIAMIFAILTR